MKLTLDKTVKTWYNKYMKNIDNAKIIKYVLEAHGDQRYGDMPYIVHLMLVSRHFTDPTKQAIALLHDVMEDNNNISHTDLFYEFGSEIANMVAVLTHQEDETYFDYIERVKLNPLATEIKIADLEENIFISKYKFTPSQPSLSRYEKALRILKGEIE